MSDDGFYGWYDPSPKRTVPEKIADAMAGYRAKRGVEPTLALCNDADVVYLADIDVVGVAYVPRHTFYLTHPDEEVTP